MGLFSGIASIFGGAAQKKASHAAEAAQLDYLSQGLGAIKNQNAQTQASLAPYLQSGTSALGEINALLGLDTAGTAGAPGTVDWQAYVQGNPDALANWNSVRGTKDDRFGGDIAKFGEFHYNSDGARRDLAPFMTGGTSGTAAVDGASAQAEAIAQLEASPYFQSLIRNGEQGILQNASATGGLRGGNVQRGLADFRSDALVQTINDQLTRLGGLSGAGLSAANSAGQFGAGAAGNMSNILGQQGQVRSGGLLTRGGITAGQIGNIGGILDTVAGAVIPGGGGAANIGGILKGLF